MGVCEFGLQSRLDSVEIDRHNMGIFKVTVLIVSCQKKILSHLYLLFCHIYGPDTSSRAKIQHTGVGPGNGMRENSLVASQEEELVEYVITVRFFLCSDLE